MARSPTELGRARRARPGGGRRRAAAPVLPAHRRGRDGAGGRDRTPSRQRRRRGAAAERAARRRHRVSAGQDPARAAELELRYRRLLRVGAFVLGAHPQARFRGSRRGDDRLAGGGAAGAGRPTPGRRGGRVRAASAGPGRSAEPGHAADRCLVRRAAHVPVDSRQRPSRAGQPGRLLAGLLGRPAAGPGHRGQPTSLADDRGPFRTPRVAYRRHPGEPFRPAAGFCLRCSCGRWRSRPGRGGPGGHIRRDP